VNEHAADPHYEPAPTGSRPLEKGQSILIDAWAKENRPGSIFADITWVGHLGGPIPAEYQKVFEIVRDARDAAIRKVETELAAGRRLLGCEVDDACRAVIEQAGFGASFIHRTGHSIHEMTHGNGTCIDNLESLDDRPIVPRTCFSIEPGIYLPGRFGIRSEIDILIDAEGKPEVTGVPAQKELIVVRC